MIIDGAHGGGKEAAMVLFGTAAGDAKQDDAFGAAKQNNDRFKFNLNTVMA